MAFGWGGVGSEVRDREGEQNNDDDVDDCDDDYMRKFIQHLTNVFVVVDVVVVAAAI